MLQEVLDVLFRLVLDDNSSARVFPPSALPCQRPIAHAMCVGRTDRARGLRAGDGLPVWRADLEIQGALDHFGALAHDGAKIDDDL
jgi:hypothetical protein